MSERAFCPSCGTKLGPDVEACPNCPWSHSAPDDEAPGPPLGNARLRVYLVPAIVLALVGLGIWTVSDTWLRLAQQGVDDAFNDQPGANPITGETGLRRPREDEEERERPAEPETEEDTEIVISAPDPAPSRPKAPRRAKAASPRRKAAAPADAEEAAGVLSIAGQGVPPRDAAKEWRLRGRVFDLVTLKPLPGARLTFADRDSAAKAETSTDGEGRYKAVLPALERRGYMVTVAKMGYAPSYAGPETPGVADLDPASRAELARQLSRTLEPPAVLEPGSAEPFFTNFFLAPVK